MSAAAIPPHPPGESSGDTVISVSLAFGVVTAVIIALRLFTRAYVIKHVGFDDILMTIAAVLSWAFIICSITAANHGLGSHLDDVMARGAQNFMTYLQIVWLSSIFYNACLGFIKISVLALYTRLGDRILKNLALIMIAIVGCSATANVLVCIFQCAPIQAAWDLSITEKTCVNINAFYLANASTNIATDILTYTLPIPLVLKLQVPKKQKIALGIMLSLGLLACVSSVIRITFIPRMLVSSDPTYAISNAMYWSVIETNIGIWAASIPSYKALAKRYLPFLLGEYSSKQYPTGQKSGSTGPFHKMKNLSSKSRGFNGSLDIKEITDDAASHDSEERLNVPNGRIVATTDIVSRVEQANAASYHSK